jgi:phage-related holin
VEGTTIKNMFDRKGMYACIVAIWLICNEIISILENMIDIGIDIPPFLQVKNIKKQMEDKVTMEEGEKDENKQ